VILGVARGAELKAVLVVPLAIDVERLAIDVVFGLDVGGAVGAGRKRAPGKKLLGGALEVTQGGLEADYLVLELEGSGPLDIETLDAIDSGILDGCTDGLGVTGERHCQNC